MASLGVLFTPRGDPLTGSKGVAGVISKVVNGLVMTQYVLHRIVYTYMSVYISYVCKYVICLYTYVYIYIYSYITSMFGYIHKISFIFT